MGDQRTERDKEPAIDEYDFGPDKFEEFVIKHQKLLSVLVIVTLGVAVFGYQIYKHTEKSHDLKLIEMATNHYYLGVMAGEPQPDKEMDEVRTAREKLGKPINYHVKRYFYHDLAPSAAVDLVCEKGIVNEECCMIKDESKFKVLFIRIYEPRKSRSKRQPLWPKEVLD